MQNLKKKLIGNVISDKMDKTVVVKVCRRVKDKRYGKNVTVTKKYKVHDEHEKSKLGDEVQIIESRPYSKTKRWALTKVI